MNEFGRKALKSIKEVLPGTLKTCIWILKVTVLVSFIILFLKYFNILPWISTALEPVFSRLGLPGEASLAFVTGFFVNVYSAIAVAATLNLDARSITILSVMVLCAHNIIVETAVQKKTGSSALRMGIVRTLSAFILAYVLNLLMPGGKVIGETSMQFLENPDFWQMFKEWLISTIKLVLKISVLIFALNIMQRLLADFGAIKWISKFLGPVLNFFGLPKRCSFLWIIANVLGLAYGAAAMIDEIGKGVLTKRDVDLLNTHIGISHSNLEDLMLLASVGGIWWVMLFARWGMSFILVWEYRLELWIRNKFLNFASPN